MKRLRIGQSKEYLTKEEMTEFVDEIGNVFNSTTLCSAKWLQGTTLLYNGTTHSCHHNVRHKINFEDVQKDCTLIHNTPEKIKDRELMKGDVRPPSCQYCWKFEDAGSLSDRHYKTSTYQWSQPYLERLKTNTPTPTYLEVAFDYTCNLKCMYCSPESSSKWREEIERFGPYNTTEQFNSLDHLRKTDRLPISNRQYNPYVEAFWKWWSELSNELRVFRITGGEPLLSKDLWNVIEDISNNPREDLILGINTNMSVSDKMIEKFISKCSILENNVKRLEIYTSCEAKGNQAEYIRYGLNYDNFISSCRKLLERTKRLHLTFMCTINALSLTTLTEYIKDLQALQKEFGNRVNIDLPLLYYPDFQSIHVLPYELAKKLLEGFNDHMAITGSDIDKERSKRLLEALNPNYRNRELLQENFRRFYREYDLRRGVDFKEVFPEYRFLFKVDSKRPTVRLR